MGCEANANITINVTKNRSLYVPSAFSPNGDGINDLFFPFDNNNVEEVRLWQVLDRWGNLIHEAENTIIGGPDLEWDGTFNNQLAPTGVYLWRAIVVYKDQQIRTLSGDVLLMR
jgi:gliding motility-associated-like protein